MATAMARREGTDPSKRILRSLFGLYVALAVAPCTQACYSGLVLIPTTDVAGAYTWVLDNQWQGYSQALRTEQLVFNTELGIGERFEIGLDLNATSGTTDRRLLLNAKWVFFSSDRFRLKIAAGVQNMDERFMPHPFLVATKDWGVLRTHLGMQRESDGSATNWFVGVDRILEDTWQFMADYTSGQSNYASAGAGWMGRRWQVFLGAQWPNAGGSPVVVLHVVLTGKYGKGKG